MFFCKDPKEDYETFVLVVVHFLVLLLLAFFFKDFSEALLVVYCARHILLSNQYVILHKWPKSRGDI